jgi:hypothetical protein
MNESALAVQIGGNHYKQMAVQPVEFALVNGLCTAQANILKYLCRAELKGRNEDIRKAAHYCDLWMELVDSYGMQWTAFQSLGRIPLETFLDANRISPHVEAILGLICEKPSHVLVMAAKALILKLLEDPQNQ